MKRILSMFLAVTLIATMLSCVCGLSVSAATYDVAEAFASGTGTSDDPYVIETVEQLALLAQKVNSADENDAEYASACYKLGANIVMNENVLKSDNMVNGTISKYGELANLADGSVPFVWTPIGNSNKTMFSGVFDGDGHSISGMYSKGGYCGLFGFIKDATIKNLKLVDFYSYGTANEGNAGVATSADGTTTFSDLWVNGHVSQFNNAMPSALLVGSVSGNVTFTNCISNGIAKGIDCRENTLSNEIPSYRSIGTATGFVGQLSQNSKTVFDNCVNNASVFGGNAAGFVGLCYEGNQNGATVTFTDCINYGDITAIRFSGYGYSTERGISGGFIAYGAKTGEVKMTRCLNAGIITGETYAGGFIGKIKNQSWLGATYNHTLSNCYNIGNVSVAAIPEQLATDKSYNDTTPYEDVLLAGDYIGYVKLSQQYNDRDVNNWTFTDCSYIPCGCTDRVNYEQGEKLTHTGEITEGSEEDFKAGAWLGADTSKWDFSIPTLTLVTGGNAHIHSYSIVGTDPDCTNAGEKTYTCTECGYKFTIKKAALGHTYTEEITTEPDCTPAGVKTLTGSVCNHVDTEPIEALGHDYVDGICTRCNQRDPESIIYVAQIGENKYETLAEAVAAVGDGETITMLCNANGDGIEVKSGSNFTLDMASFTYTVDGNLVGSKGTETLGFQLRQDSTIVIKNGTIKSDIAKVLIQNYSNLTLDNVTLIGGEITGYVLSNNYGDTVLKNGTTITAVGNNVAFDVYYGMRAVYDGGVNVTIADSNVVINGKVEYGAAKRVADADESLYKLIVPANYELTLSDGLKLIGNEDGTQRVTKIVMLTVTVIGRNGKATEYSVENYTTITLADFAPYSYGYTVTAWADGDGNEITDATITVTEDIKLVPTYSVAAVKYKLTVSGSTDDANLTGEYYYNDKIKIVFDTTALGEGEYFSGWINAFTGEVISYKPNYTFYIGADATITANITTDESTAVPVVGITDVCDVNGDGSKYSFLMERSMPYKGYTYVSSGFIYSASEFSDPTDASLRKSVSTETALNAQYRLTVNLKNATDIYIVAFLTYEDAEGNQITIYSDEAPRHYTKTVS